MLHTIVYPFINRTNSLSTTFPSLYTSYAYLIPGLNNELPNELAGFLANSVHGIELC